MTAPHTPEWKECPTCGGLSKDLTDTPLGQGLKDFLDETPHIQSNEEIATIQCRSCGGDGWTAEPDPWDETGQTPIQVQCYHCHGEGEYTTLDEVRLVFTTKDQQIATAVERERQVGYQLVKEFYDNLITIAIENEHLRGCVTSNQIIKAFADFCASSHEALTPLPTKDSI